MRQSRWLAFGLVAVLMASMALLKSSRESSERRWTGPDGQLVAGYSWLWRSGEIAVRDFGSTHGPLAQLVAALAAGGDTVEDVDAAPARIFRAYRLAGVCLLVVILAVRVRDSRAILVAGLLLSLLGIPLTWAAWRALGAVLAAEVTGRWLFGDSRKPRWHGALLVSASWLAVQLISADFAVYLAVAALIAAVSGFALFGPKSRPAGPELQKRFVTLVAAWLLLNLLFAFWAVATGRAGDAFGESQLRMLRIIATYPDAVGLAWQFSAWVSIAALAGVVMTAWVWWRHLRWQQGSELGGTVMLGFLSLLALRGGMIRSDADHLVLALAPLSVSLAVLAPGRSSGERHWVLWCSAALSLTAVYAPQASALFVDRWVAGERVAVAASFGTPTAAVPIDWPPVELRAAAAQDRGRIVSFPLDNRMGWILGRPLVTPYHQVYAAHTLELQQDYVDQLERLAEPPHVVYAVDRVGAWELDGGQSISRSPIVFEYLLRRFERMTPRLLDRGYLYLQRRPSTGDLEVESVAYTVSPKESGLEIRFDNPATCPLLRLRLRIDHPVRRVLGWPAAIEARAFYRGARRRSTRIPRLAGSASFETYFSLASPSEFARLFDTGSRPRGRAIDRLDLAPEDGGVFGVRASGIEVEKVECVEGTTVRSGREGQSGLLFASGPGSRVARSATCAVAAEVWESLRTAKNGASSWHARRPSWDQSARIIYASSAP